MIKIWLTNDQMDEMSTPLWVFCLLRQWLVFGILILILVVSGSLW